MKRQRWACSKCGGDVTAGIAVSFDPRYATGLCLHGKNEFEATAERVPLSSHEYVEAVLDSRTYSRAVKRALRKQLSGQELSANEAAALARRERERAS